MFRFVPPSMDDFHNWVEKEKERIFESVKEAYLLACMEAVNFARTVDTYKDRTNNLRSSIGFVLYYNGELVHEDFQLAGKGAGMSKNKGPEGPEGMKSGQELAHEVAKMHNEGFVAIIVAGMHYALYVEANGFDVLTGATLNLPEKLREHFTAIDKRHGTRFSRR